MANPMEKAWDEYCDLVDAYAEEIFEKHVKPWLVKNHCIFLAGNGTWYLSKVSKNGVETELFEPETFGRTCPKEIAKWLNMEIPGMHWNVLGSMMPDYRQTEYEIKVTRKYA